MHTGTGRCCKILGEKKIKIKNWVALQAALDGLAQWAATWGTQFNVAKCKVMQLGPRNGKRVYTMDGQALQETTTEKDIRVYVSQKLKPAEQCRNAARMAQVVLGQLTRAFHYRDRHVFVRLYKQYVRPHLEFCTQAWAPWNEEDKMCLEKVQQRDHALPCAVSHAESTDVKRIERHEMDLVRRGRDCPGEAVLFMALPGPLRTTLQVTSNSSFGTGRYPLINLYEFRIFTGILLSNRIRDPVQTGFDFLATAPVL